MTKYGKEFQFMSLKTAQKCCMFVVSVSTGSFVPHFKHRLRAVQDFTE